MSQGRRRARFALEALDRQRVGRQVARQELQRHAPLEMLVIGGIHHAHAAAAQACDHAIVRNGAANHLAAQMILRLRGQIDRTSYGAAAE